MSNAKKADQPPFPAGSNISTNKLCAAEAFRNLRNVSHKMIPMPQRTTTRLANATSCTTQSRVNQGRASIFQILRQIGDELGGSPREARSSSLWVSPGAGGFVSRIRVMGLIAKNSLPSALSTVSQPDQNLLRLFVYFTHQGNLNTLFSVIALINTYSIDPNGAAACAPLFFSPLQEFVEIVSDTHNFPAADEVVHLAGLPPCIR
jgi:hypothetical protein